MKTEYASVVLIAGAALALCACSSKPPVITVGSKNTTEQLILGEILAAQLEKQLPGVTIDRKLGLGGTLVVQGALQSSGIDLYVEDIGTALGTILKEDLPADETISLERARSQYKTLFQLAILQPLGFHHKFVIVSQSTLPPDVKGNDLTTVGASGRSWTMGIAYDLFDRKDIYTVLTTKYKISMRVLPRRMEATPMYEELRAGKLELGGGYSTDAYTDQPGFRVLKDDKQMFPAEPACIVVRMQTLAAQRDLERALDPLVGKFTNESMRKLNQEVDLKHRQPATVAKEFLASAGL
jgi:glycine betaine/choline ABC-type transport system substrate-binding protein